MAPAGIKLVMPPTAVDVTLTLIVQDEFAANETPVMPTEVAPAAADNIPPGQVVLAAGVAEITMPFAGAPEVPFVVK
jgi:hypothetical protein